MAAVASRQELAPAAFRSGPAEVREILDRDLEPVTGREEVRDWVATSPRAVWRVEAAKRAVGSPQAA